MIAGLSKLVVAIIGFFIVGLLIASMSIFGWGFFQRSTADFRGETDQIEQTQADGTYRIAAYEKFYDLCASVQTQEATLKSLEQELETDPSESRKEQIQATMTAVRNNRASLINQYNADARKEDTRGNFLASDLPYEINIEEEITTCFDDSE